MARFELSEFAIDPTWDQFDACRKTDLLLVADFFSVIIPRSAPKHEVKAVLETHLVRLGILPERERSLGVALGHTPGAEATEVADGSERRPRMDPSGALSPGLDPLLAVRLRELELEIKIQEREAEALRLKAVQVSAERDLELRRMSLAGDKPVPLPRSSASLSTRSPATAGPQAAAAPPVPKPRSPARTTAVVTELNIKHNVSSAYHPQSQGALERFHQTFKNMLRTYCFETGKDWDEGVPLLLFAIRDTVQESTGFSPNSLIFGHSVRGPLRILYDQWLSPPSTSGDKVLGFVSKLRERLQLARRLAKQNLCSSQAEMKCRYDRKAIDRTFNVGDHVLALLPVTGSALQTRFCGPYKITEKLSSTNYVLATPDRRRKFRKTHVNMLKPFITRSTDVNVTTPSPPLPPSHSFVPLATASVSEYAPETDNLHLGRNCLPCARLSNTQALQSITGKLSDLPLAAQSDLKSLIDRFPSLFLDIQSQTSVLQHDIDVNGHPPIKQHPYRVSPHKRALLQQETEYLLENRFAVPSNSPWCSPCLLVPKPDTTYRFCTDYRKVNAITVPDSFPLPRMEDCVDRVGSAKFVTKLDLLKGYWQVPLTSRASDISAFATPDTFLQYTVMAFGLRNAPATFQRLMTIVLGDVPNCDAYLDDIVVYSDTWEHHMQLLETVFTRLRDASLVLNLEKCEFGKGVVTYLGKVVGNGMVRPLDAKVQAISSFPTPQTPPTPDFDKPFKLEVDASGTGAGAVLLQEDNLGIDHPLCYFSRKFVKNQLAYSTIEKEALALLLALQHFEDDELNADAYCALAPLLDNVSLGLIFRDTENKGRESLQVLREHYIGRGRPRIVSLYITLTSLKKADTETVTEYIIRAEQIFTALRGAGEAPSEGLMMAMIMRGLPEKYKPFTLMVTHSSAEMKLAEFKAKLRNFEASEDAEPVAEMAGERVLKARTALKKRNGGSSTGMACWRCGEKGHRKDECTRKVWCGSCKSTSHTDKACRKKERVQGSRCARAGDGGGRAASGGGRIGTRRPAGDDTTFRAETEDTCKPAQQRQIGGKGLIVDTGATSHMLNDRSRFKTFDSTFKPESHSMELADGRRTFGLAEGRGDAQVCLIDSDRHICTVTLKNALYIPSFPQGLFSVKCATAHGAKVLFEEGNDVLMTPNGTRFNIQVCNRMYYLQTECDENDVCNVSHDIQTWHEIMGHCNYDDILKLQDVTVGMHIKGAKRTPDKECHVCIEGKFTQTRNRNATDKVKAPLELVNTDLAGPVTNGSIDSYKYMQSFTDVCTGVVFTYFLKAKSDAVQATEKFLADVAPYGSVKCIRSDNGTEFTSREFKTLLRKNKIRHETSCPYSPHQNVIAEREGRTLFEMARWHDKGSPAFLVYYPTKGKVQKHRLVKFITKTTCESETQTQDLGFDPIINNEKTDTSRPSATSTDIQTDSPQSPGDDGEEHHRVTPQVSSSGRYPTRERKPPSYLSDYTQEDSGGDDSTLTSVDYCYRAVCGVPLTFKQAMASPQAGEWKRAMDEEMQSLEENQTFTLTKLPEGGKTVGGRWVYSIKEHGDGREQYKARFVAKGYSQRAGIDYGETFSPTANMTSVRVVMQKATQENLVLHQMDVKTAYPHAPIDRDIYIDQPEGYEKVGENLVCKLEKSIYGLKQSGRNWNEMLHKCLINDNFTQNPADHCVYTKESEQAGKVIIVIWVDDLIIAANNTSSLEQVKAMFSTRFKMKDLGRLKHFLGIDFSQSDDCITMSQQRYVEKILNRFDMQECRTRKTPCEQKVDYTDDAPKMTDVRKYREAVGSLIYLATCTRPDLCFVVGKLSQHFANPTEENWITVKHVLRYLRGTTDKQLTFRKSSDGLGLRAYSDADWGADTSDRRSTSGYCVSMSKDSSLVSWRSKKQPTVALSTCEAEYMALALTIQECIYLEQLLKGMDSYEYVQTVVHEDNQGTIALVKNPVCRQRCKHVDIKYHFIRSIIKERKMTLVYCPTDKMIADAMTKPVSKVKLIQFSGVMFGASV
ncbi:hypothetical protein MHYP_G00310440 [Metynnis hypsauchen]